MATDAKKMIRLVQERTAYGVPKDAPGVCTMQDEDGNPRIKLGFDAHRDYITVMGYEAAPEVSVDICAALAALCGLAVNNPVMTARSLTEEDLAAELSDNGQIDPENRPALSIAIAMFREAVRMYAKTYTEKKRSLRIRWSRKNLYLFLPATFRNVRGSVPLREFTAIFQGSIWCWGKMGSGISWRTT